MKTAEEIFNKHSWEAIGAISPSKDFCLNAMQEYAQQIASLAWDEAFDTTTEGWNGVYPFTRGYQGATDAQKKAYDRAKEQFLNSIFNNHV